MEKFLINVVTPRSRIEVWNLFGTKKMKKKIKLDLSWLLFLAKVIEQSLKFINKQVKCWREKRLTGLLHSVPCFISLIFSNSGLYGEKQNSFEF